MLAFIDVEMHHGARKRSSLSALSRGRFRCRHQSSSDVSSFHALMEAQIFPFATASNIAKRDHANIRQTLSEQQ